MNRRGGSFLSRAFPKTKKYVYPLLIVIFLLSIFLRYYGFNQPHGLTFDEGLYAHLLARQVQKNPADYSTQAAYQRLSTQVERPLPKYLDRPLFKHPPLYCYLIALNYKVFGQSDRAAVSVSILLGSLMVLAVFFLGKILYDDRVGLLAAAFLCIEPVHWVCSERIWMETTMSFFILLSIFLFVLGQKQERYFLFSGIAIGLALLTKYPGILALFIVVSFAFLFDRSLLKKKGFWALCVTAFLMFVPWLIWNWRVYGSFKDIFVSAHSLATYKKNALDILSVHKKGLLALLCLAGLSFIMRKKLKGLLEWMASEQTMSRRKGFFAAASSVLLIVLLFAVPFFRQMVRELFIFKDTVLVGWSNPFRVGPWHFYLTRLSELAPFYVFSYFSVFFLFGNNKGDKLLILSSAWILIVFILWGNYQSRYILPAVPFLVLLSSRGLVWVYDKLSGPRNSQLILKILFVGVSAYFLIKTLKVDSLIAIGPDFGYF